MAFLVSLVALMMYTAGFERLIERGRLCMIKKLDLTEKAVANVVG